MGCCLTCYATHAVSINKFQRASYSRLSHNTTTDSFCPCTYLLYLLNNHRSTHAVHNNCIFYSCTIFNLVITHQRDARLQYTAIIFTWLIHNINLQAGVKFILCAKYIFFGDLQLILYRRTTLHIIQVFKYHVEELKFVKSIKTIVTRCFNIYLYAVFFSRCSIMTSEYVIHP